MTYIPSFLKRLGLDASADEKSIRRAYAVELKKVDQELDPTGFQSLREAYEAALAWVKRGRGALGSQLMGPDFSQLARTQAPADAAPEPQKADAPRFTYSAQVEQTSQDPVAQVPDVHTLVEAVMQSLLEKAAGWPDDHGVLTDARARFDLDQCFKDPRLTNLEARFLFERRIAELIVHPDCPRPYLMFQAAVRVFDWKTDRRRLAQFGAAGRRLNDEIDSGGISGSMAPRTSQSTGSQRGSSQGRSSGFFGGFSGVWLIGFLFISLIRVLFDSGAKGPASTPPPRLEGASRTSDSSRPEMVRKLDEIPLWQGTPAPSGSKKIRGAVPAEMGRPDPFAQGQSCYAKGQFQEAIRAYTKAIEANPKNGGAYNNRGIAYAAIHQREQALQDYKKAIQLNPKDAVPHNNLGNVWHQLGQYEEAIGEYDQAIQLDKAYALAWVNRARAFLDQNNPDRAYTDLNQAIGLEPQSSRAHYLRGMILTRRDQSEAALADFTAAIYSDPRYAWAYLQRGKVYEGLSRLDQASRDFEEVLRLDRSLRPYIPSTFFARHKELDLNFASPLKADQPILLKGSSTP